MGIFVARFPNRFAECLSQLIFASLGFDCHRFIPLGRFERIFETLSVDYFLLVWRYSMSAYKDLPRCEIFFDAMEILPHLPSCVEISETRLYEDETLTVGTLIALNHHLQI